jgi:hypothetical protein
MRVMGGLPSGQATGSGRSLKLAEGRHSRRLTVVGLDGMKERGLAPRGLTE